MRRGFSPKSNDVPGYNVHLNEGGGYLFSYPDTWEITSAGDTARLISPDEEVVISFGTSASGTVGVGLRPSFGERDQLLLKMWSSSRARSNERRKDSVRSYLVE